MDGIQWVIHVWNLALEVGQVPEARTQVRIVTIPKDDGGLRGLGIAVAAWRTGMSTIIDQIYPWASTWLHDDLVGGIQNKDAMELHDKLMSAIAIATDAGGYRFWGQNRSQEMLRCR